MTAAGALLHQLCPKCRQGPIYGAKAMNEFCPVCSLRFERETGYFIGAMYISYLVSLPAILALVLFLWWYASVPYGWALIGAVLLYLPFVRWVVRFSRVAWIHLDRRFDPER